ncbi:uncharacterized protein LOC124168177 isoform X2 [Ischnura elegans]|nr:uncharacterized protein LOC124168177 isoform X2 [Ischnura elegans]
MDNTAFDGGEAVLLAARGLPNREVVNGSGGGAARGGRSSNRAGGGGAVAVNMGMGDPPGPPQMTQTNGGPNCHCPPHEEGTNMGYREKSPGGPMPIVAQESPWHQHKTIYLAIIVVALVLWMVIYTIISELNLA